MSEDEIANGAPVDAEAVEDGAAEAVEGGAAADEEVLDEEASALLKELEESQLEVQRMIQAQRERAAELGGLKDELASDLQELQDDAWKLQVFAELEMLKRQLAALNNLDADLDAMEAKLDEGGEEALDDAVGKELEAARARTLDMLPKHRSGANLTSQHSTAAWNDASTPAGATDGAAEASARADEEGEEDVAALQDELDAELAAMHKKLQAIKEESAIVAARKAQLELELMQLIRDGADELAEQLGGMDVEGAVDKACTDDAIAPA